MDTEANTEEKTRERQHEESRCRIRKQIEKVETNREKQ